MQKPHLVISNREIRSQAPLGGSLPNEEKVESWRISREHYVMACMAHLLSLRKTTLIYLSLVPLSSGSSVFGSKIILVLRTTRLNAIAVIFRRRRRTTSSRQITRILRNTSANVATTTRSTLSRYSVSSLMVYSAIWEFDNNDLPKVMTL